MQVLRMKPERTLLVTAAKLRGLGACPDGIEDVRFVLPVRISTDPVENVELAQRLVSADHGWRILWFCNAIAQAFNVEEVDYSDGPRSGTDAFVLAQQLAHAVDHHFYAVGK